MYDRLCNTNMAHDAGPRPATVESFPQDESPYGVRGLGGNARDWCLNDPGGEMYLGWRACRGGNWMSPSPAARCAYRAGAPMNSIQPMTTIRLASVLSLPAGKDPWPLEPPGASR
jgi:serine/threonine-protein kinase